MRGGQTEAVTEPEPEYDLGGRTVKIAYWGDLTPPESDTQYVEKMDYLAQIEEDFNCKIEFTGPFNWWLYMDQALLAAMNNELFADIFVLQGLQLGQYTANDFLYPLDDIVDLSREGYNMTQMDSVASGGKHYLATSGGGSLARAVLFNKRILEENNIDWNELYELQENREWTWDKLLEYAQACTKVVNGETVTWGLGAYGSAPVFTEMLMNSNGATPAKYDDKGNMVNNLNDPAVLEALQFAYDLVNTYHVCYTGSNAWGTWEELWKQGKVAFFMTELYVIDPYFEALAEDEFGFLMCPIGPQATDYYDFQNPPQGWCIPACEPDPEAIGAIFERYFFMGENISDEDTEEVWGDEINYKSRLFNERDWDAFVIGNDPSYDLVRVGEASTWFRDNILWSDWGLVNQIPPRTWVEERSAQVDAAFAESNILPSKEELEAQVEARLEEEAAAAGGQ